MKIWVDADAAPRDAKEVVYRAAQRLSIEAVLVANRRLTVPPHNSFISTVVVPGGADAADAYIAEHAADGDIAITADIPLAAMLVEREIVVIDPRGEVLDADNVRERLSIRDFMESLRGSGIETGGAPPYGPREKQAFAGALDRVLTARMKRRGERGPD